MTIKLGQRYKDMVTGFTGIAVEKATHINGCVQFLLVPQAKEDGKYPEQNWLDHQRMEFVDEGIGGRVFGAGSHLNVLGKVVRDTATGFQGVVVCTTEDLCGNVEHGVRPKVGEDNKMVEAVSLSAKRWELVGGAVAVNATEGGADMMPDAPRR